MKKYLNGKEVEMTAQEIVELENLRKQCLIDNPSLKNKNNKKQAPYINQRRNAYPEIGDQLDMLWHSIDKNPDLKTQYFDFYEAIKAVKVKYGKDD